MDITISYFMLVAVVMIALVGGFWIGRSVGFMMSETENRISRDDARIPLGWSIGSPVTGTVRSFCGSEGKGVLIQPEWGKIYAPASGKITKLQPGRN